MKSAALLLELEALCEQKGFRIRRERGAFSGNDCVMEGEKLILLNSRQPSESHIGTLSRVLHSTGVDDLYVKPAVRRRLADLWKAEGTKGAHRQDPFPLDGAAE